MPDEPLYAFDIALHAAPRACSAGVPHVDEWGTWTTLQPSHAALNAPLAMTFDTALERLAALDRMVVEPDGAILWTCPVAGAAWQVDGIAWDLGGRLLRVDLKGTCPAVAFDAMLEACGWPGQAVVVQLVRPAIVLDLATFRSHATARWRGGSGETLRLS